MPRHSRRTDEPSTSTGIRRKRAISSDSEEEFENSRSTTIQTEISPQELSLLSNNMVKFFLNHSANKFPIKRADLGKNLNVTPKIFPEVYRNCRKKLEEIYGLSVTEIQESKSARVFIVHSAFKSAITHMQMPQSQTSEITLLFIILSYIFMKGGEVQEAHILQFLEQINISDKEVHPYFGDAAKLVRDTFPRQLYLKRTKVEIEGVNDVQIHVSWGIRAMKEFDKRAVLEAVSKIMKKSPANFINQYHEAFGEEPMTQAVVVE